MIKNLHYASLAFAALLIASAVNATPVVVNLDVNFQANQSLWAGGPSGGFDTGRQEFGLSFVGAFYDVAANSGTVNANVNGMIQVSYENTVTLGNAGMFLSFVPGASNVNSAFGANAQAGVYYDLTFTLDNPWPIPDIDVGVDGDINVLDLGFLLEPFANFDSTLDMAQIASDLAELAGFGSVNPCSPILNCSLGASINLDIAQSIEFTPTGIGGLIMYENQTSGDMGFTPFNIGDNDVIELNFSQLTAGIWDFTLMDLSLSNLFRNDIDLAIRPQFDYLIDSWSPGSLPFGLLDETFSLDFDQIASLGSFSINIIPLPATVWLLGTAVIALIGLGRRN